MSARFVLSVAALIAAASAAATAQRFVCYTIRSGDTAATLAERLTGDARNRRAAGFQIVDPVTARIVSKSSYDVILPGWQVCLAPQMLTNGQIRSPEAPTASASLPGSARDYVDWLGRRNLLYVGFAAFLIAAALLAWPLAAKYVDKRWASLRRMERFGHMFIREFERPLVSRAPADHPIQSRLRFAALRAHMDILLTPAGGRRYPNLSDHRRNLDYDVERVLRTLQDDELVKGAPRMEGPWVVIPFRLETDRKQAGAR